MNRILSSIVLMTMGVLSGCILDSDDDVKSEPLDGVTYRIDIDLAKIGIGKETSQEISLNKEAAFSTTSNYTFIMVTDSAYPCFGYWIWTRDTVKFDIITVEVKGIYPPAGDICSPMMAPAQSYGALRLTDGNYQLRIKQLGAVDKYRVIIANGEASFEPIQTSFTTAIND